jgi:hypothetical protein
MLPLAADAMAEPVNEQLDPGSGWLESIRDTCVPEIVPVITPENVTSAGSAIGVTGGDVSTETCPVAELPVWVGVHVTRSARRRRSPGR